MEVEHPVLLRNFRVSIRVDDWELRDEVFYCVFGAFQIVGAKGNDLGIRADYALIMLSQLNELAAAERSPKRPVEDHDHVLISAKRIE